MNQRLIAEIGRSQRLAIINRLKRSDGLAVRELAADLKMSYMGVKQHCIALHRDGYLDTWRRPRPVGRPEMVYRLTRRAHELFPVANNALLLELLDAARTLFGAAAPEKLLFQVFQKKAAAYAGRIRGDSLAARAKWLARLRDNEGYMADLDTADGLRIVESNSPIFDVLQAFPIVRRLEEDMFRRVLQTTVRREETTVSGLFRCTFYIG